MTFLIVTHVPHIATKDGYSAYAPYVREMNIWLKHVDRVVIVAPVEQAEISAVHLLYEHPDIKFVRVPAFDLLGLSAIISAFFKVPVIGFRIFNAMRKADHIHLRCPGNVGFVGCCTQFFFPRKRKTAKYAGNWDPKSKQPWSYKLQQRILSNTAMTKNMQVLVYGRWKDDTANIRPFFTATYHESEKIPLQEKNLKSRIHFIFVGTLVKGKHPLYAVQLVESLLKKGFDADLNLYGNGPENTNIKDYLRQHRLEKSIFMKGSQTSETIKKAFQESHFVVLPSESEGWPKVVAEGMFWGCVPIATAVSCVPFMVGFGERGILLKMDPEDDAIQIENVLKDEPNYHKLRILGAQWSRNYTLDAFESAITKLLKP